MLFRFDQVIELVEPGGGDGSGQFVGGGTRSPQPAPGARAIHSTARRRQVLVGRGRGSWSGPPAKGVGMKRIAVAPLWAYKDDGTSCWENDCEDLLLGKVDVLQGVVK